jgi:cytoskeletal protein CcmA (bactofilin family)
MGKEQVADSTSLLSKNVKIEGEIQGPENLHIEGFIKGSIKLSGDVFVCSTGIVEADVEAKNIVIQGELKGNVMARQQLEIHPTGKLIGDCSAASIDIKEGAVFEGRSNMIKSQGSSIGMGTAVKAAPMQTSKNPDPKA